jgi:hypothetical protein
MRGFFPKIDAKSLHPLVEKGMTMRLAYAGSQIPLEPETA